MNRRYVTADVFTNQPFGGNPVAVVLDAEGLSTPQMQRLALEFNYSETTFVLPPADPAHTARVRIFTPRTEVPFAGHPNVGTAFVLAREARLDNIARSNRFVFEEAAGLVHMRLLKDGETVIGAELQAPEPLSLHATLNAASVSAALSLLPRDISTRLHLPQIVSVGLPFLVVELESRDALRRAAVNLKDFGHMLPLAGADAIFAYWREQEIQSSNDSVLHARMFSPLDGIGEDPATGSASAATVALLATLEDSSSLQRKWRIHQGVDMGRPSILLGGTLTRNGLVDVYIGGCCVPMFEGSFTMEGEY